MIAGMLARYAGYAIASCVIVAVAMLQPGMWTRRAHRLAARADIALPPTMEWRVARLLRAQNLFGVLGSQLAVPPVMTVLAGVAPPGDSIAHAERAWATWFPWCAAGLPALFLAMVSTQALWPRWRASGPGRVTHLRAPAPVWRAFTWAELAATALGVALTAAFAGWGLWRIHAPATSWIICMTVIAGTTAASWHVAAFIMNRPSSASDALELAWDDMLRFQCVRGALAAMAWAPASIFMCFDWIMAESLSSDYSTFPPLYVPFVFGLLLWLVFRQGRHRWREAWETRAPSAPPPL